LAHTRTSVSRSSEAGRLRSESHLSGEMVLCYSGRLDAINVGRLWRQTAVKLQAAPPRQLTVLADEITYCDGSGIGLLFWLRLQGRQKGFPVDFKGLRSDLAAHLDLFNSDNFNPDHCPESRFTIAEIIGRSVWQFLRDVADHFMFVGEITSCAFKSISHPRCIRWKDVLITAERAGANAVGIVAIIGFLFGLIMAFSGAMPLRQFGADVYVADLAAIAIVRVLGPFITAVILAGRSGSAFAAELGTMKINNEIDALVTMGLEPVRFLALPKVLATMAITPLLVVIADIFGLIGSGVVILSIGFPLVTYVSHVRSAVSLDIWLIGLVKGVVFGALIAGVGCLRGLQTETGPSAVGISTTRAVVSGIVLVVAAEGVFAVLLHFLGI